MLQFNFYIFLCNYHFNLGNNRVKSKRGEEADPIDTTAVAPCEMACVSEEEADIKDVLNAIYPIL